MRNFESGLISLAYFMGPFLFGLNKYVKENPKFAINKDMTLYRKINCSIYDYYLYVYYHKLKFLFVFYYHFHYHYLYFH